MSNPIHRTGAPGGVAPAAHGPNRSTRTTRPGENSASVTALSWTTYVAVALTSLSAGYYFTIMIMIEVILETIDSTGSDRQALVRMWDGLLIGQMIGQFISAMLCDSFGTKVVMVFSTAVLLVGAILCTASSVLRGNVSGLAQFVTVAQGIVGVGIGAVSAAVSTTAIEVTQDKPAHNGRAFVLMTSGLFSVGGTLATVVFLVVLSAAQPGHLDTVWSSLGHVQTVSAGPFAYGLSINNYGSRKDGPTSTQLHRPAYLAEFKRHWVTIARTSCLWFVYDFIAYPKIVFSEAILYSVVDATLWRTAGLELLLSLFALGGSLLGAILCDPLGRRKTVLVSFNVYVVFVLIIGSAYNHLINIVPLLAVFYAVMLFTGNVGPGDLLGLIAAESYPPNVRGLFFGITSAFGTVGAVSGIHAFSAIEKNLGPWSFIIAALCGIAGVFLTYLLPLDVAGRTSTSPSEKDEVPPTEHNVDRVPALPVLNFQPDGGQTRTDTGNGVHTRDQTSSDKNDPKDRRPRLVVTNGSDGPRCGSRHTPGSRNGSHLAGSRNIPGSSNDRPSAQETRVDAVKPSPATSDIQEAPASLPKVLANDTLPQSIPTKPVVHLESFERDTDKTRPTHVVDANPAPQLQRLTLSFASAPEGAASTSSMPHVAPPIALPGPQTDASSHGGPITEWSEHIQRKFSVHLESAVPDTGLVDKVPDVQEAHAVVSEYVAATGLQKVFQEGDAFVEAVVANAANLQDDGKSFPITKENVERLIRLSLYHPVIYCDDSSSMKADRPTRWDLQRNAVDRIASVTTRAVPQHCGVSLRFINAQWAKKDNISAVDVLGAVNVLRPSGSTPLGTTLRNHILEPLVYDPLRSGSRTLDRPLLICVITDGSPNSSDDPTFENAVMQCRQALVDAGYEPTAVRFCVNQIGGDSTAAGFLSGLKNNQNIQDVVYCTTERLDEQFKQFKENGRLFDEWLLKMLSEPIMHQASSPAA
ncbi:major facilitator superfamily domain-containing protein [Fomitopsis serialis]|uniref:major facilitator superfamily domain-containing protein n=1 Tax=Fomitopsis serialis TaxID=139415 RepID=UPI002007D1F1|nr:major facilitator superfamily domain-containing protein [Neoantrodia serialis]KAH9932485.1 major facilitator superfamily domain-containing protein [Neoantrodia serialis]